MLFLVPGLVACRPLPEGPEIRGLWQWTDWADSPLEQAPAATQPLLPSHLQYSEKENGMSPRGRDYWYHSQWRKRYTPELQRGSPWLLLWPGLCLSTRNDLEGLAPPSLPVSLQRLHKQTCPQFIYLQHTCKNNQSCDESGANWKLTFPCGTGHDWQYRWRAWWKWFQFDEGKVRKPADLHISHTLWRWWANIAVRSLTLW